jgi:hypothetical protein
LFDLVKRFEFVNHRLHDCTLSRPILDSLAANRAGRASVNVTLVVQYWNTNPFRVEYTPFALD